MKPATSTGQLVYDLLIRHGHLWRRLSVSERMVLGCTSRAVSAPREGASRALCALSPSPWIPWEEEAYRKVTTARPH